MTSIDDVLKRNKAWSDRTKRGDEAFFERLANRQTPQFLWIGCSDSRVPANEILDLAPGDVFVHRNIANVVSPSDLNLLAVLQYAVEILKVRCVIVCGHYGCGGVRAALSDDDHGLIDNWLNHVRLVQRLNGGALAGLGGEARADRLCELNVIEQVRNVTHTSVVRDAWRSGQPLEVHGLVYSLRDGILQRLVTAGLAPD